MHRSLLPQVAAALLTACAKPAPTPPPASPRPAAAPSTMTPAPTAPVPAKKRTPIPATKPAAPSATARPGEEADDIEPDPLNHANLAQPLVAPAPKAGADQPQDPSK